MTWMEIATDQYVIPVVASLLVLGAVAVFIGSRAMRDEPAYPPDCDCFGCLAARVIAADKERKP